MRKILLSILLGLLFIPHTSYALLISNPATHCAKQIDGTGFKFNIAIDECSYSNAFRGDAIAKEFSLTDAYKVTDITVKLSENLSNEDVYPQGYVDVLLFGGTKIVDEGYVGHFPETSNVVYSKWLQADQDPENTHYTVKDLDLELSPGKYWLAVTNDNIWDLDSQPSGFTFRGSMAPGEVYGSPVPEPSSIFLLGGGLVGAIWRRRKSQKT